MKNGMLIWNVVLTLLAGYLLIAHFSKKGNGIGKKDATASLATSSPFRIAYFEMDSIENNFKLVKDVKAEIDKKEEAYNNSLTQLQNQYNTKMQGYQQKEKAGGMTQADYEKAMADLKQTEDMLRSRKQDLEQDYQDFVTRRNLDVKKEIEDYLSQYNKAKNFSYIVSYEEGLFYYKDSAYNITSDLIKGLNQAYLDKRK
jgi:outer membrane protein